MEEEDDVGDLDFVPPTHNLDFPGRSDTVPSTKRRMCVWPLLEVLEEEADNDK